MCPMPLPQIFSIFHRCLPFNILSPLIWHTWYQSSKCSSCASQVPLILRTSLLSSPVPLQREATVNVSCFPQILQSSKDATCGVRAVVQRWLLFLQLTVVLHRWIPAQAGASVLPQMPPVLQIYAFSFSQVSPTRYICLLPSTRRYLLLVFVLRRFIPFFLGTSCLRIRFFTVASYLSKVPLILHRYLWSSKCNSFSPIGLLYSTCISCFPQVFPMLQKRSLLSTSPP